MSEFATISLQIAAAGVIAGQVVALLLLALLVGALVQRRQNPQATLVGWSQQLSKLAVHAAAAVALVSTLGSLFLSEIIELAPCVLCWWQRIFMYPQVVVLYVGAWFRDQMVARYALALSLIGIGVAVYHIILQLGLGEFVPCGGDQLVSCGTVQVIEFGYVTIPVMSLTAFVLIALLSVFKLVRWENRAN